MMDGDAAEFVPPNRPPPFLSLDQVQELCQEGRLGLQLPPHLADHYAALFENVSAFFQLPAEQKFAAYPSIPGDTEQGYSLVPNEKEFITFRYLPRGSASASQSLAPTSDAETGWSRPQLEDRVAETWRDTAHLLRRVLDDLGAYLSLAPDAWNPLVDNSLELPATRKEATPTLLRIFRYEPGGGIAEPHRDLGLLTLCVCRGRGLQVWQRQNGTVSSPAGSRPNSDQDQVTPPAPPTTALPQWRDAPEVTLMAGDTLRILSSKRIPAAPHRVEATDSGRYSIVFALRMSTRHDIDLTAFGGRGTVNSKALWDRIRSERVNINLRKDVRDEMKARLKSEGSIA